MSVLAWPHRFLSLSDWENLPEDNRFHIEVVEGVLLVSPRPMSFHQRAVSRLDAAIDEQLPERLSSLPDVEVVLSEKPVTVRVPDVIVAATALVDTNPARYSARDVLLAVEVLSEGTVGTDRVTKFSEYAKVGIRHYWIVDLDPPTSVVCYQLVGEHYETSGEYSGTATLHLDDIPIAVDLDALTRKRMPRR